MKRYDQISSLVWLAMGVYICVESLRLPLGAWQDPGPGFLPLGSGIFLCIFACLAFSQAWMRDEDKLHGSWYSRERWKKLVLILATLFGYALILNYLGFIASTFIFLLILFRFVEPQKWIVAIGGSALASIACYMVFELWLKTQLPRGILGF